MQALFILGPALLLAAAIILLFVLDARPVDARRRTGRADRRYW